MKNDRLISVAASAVVNFVKGGGLVYSSLPDFPIIRKAKVRGLQRAVFRLAEARCIRSCGMELVALSLKNEESMPKVAEQTTREQAFEAGHVVLRLIQEIHEWSSLSYFDKKLALSNISKKTGIPIDQLEFYNVSESHSNDYVEVGSPCFVAVTMPDASRGIVGEVIDTLALLERSAQFDKDHDYPDCDEDDWDVV